MVATSFFALALAIAGSALACSPDTRPWEIRNLHTVRQGKVTTLSFDAARSDDTHAEPIHCTRREEEGVINDTFFSTCTQGYQWVATDFISTTPPQFGIFLQINLVCPPSPDEQAFSWRAGDVSPFLKCRQRGYDTVCDQATRNVILATWA